MSLLPNLCFFLFGVQAVLTQDDGCFELIGCFPVTPEFQTHVRPVSLLPESPEEIGVGFSLFTPATKEEPQFLTFPDVSEIGSKFSTFDPTLKTKIIVHGFLDNPELTDLFEASWMHEMKDEFFKHGDYNVIIVDWSQGNHLPYTQATANTRVVGAEIAYIIATLVSLNPGKVSEADFHIIGHSLGSHIAGYAGKRLVGLGRISALDPAGPYFENTPAVVRLNQTDALFVDVIHTDAFSALGAQGFGMSQAVGHVDFYPNRGYHQTGCEFGRPLSENLVEGLSNIFACSHLRSYHYFIESINSRCQFEAVQCKSEDQYTEGTCQVCGPEGCNRMGFHARNTNDGETEHQKFYLDTAGTEPYCRYFLGLVIYLRDVPDKTINTGTVSVAILGSTGISEVVQLDSRPDDYTPGESKSTVLANTLDIGEPEKILLEWEHQQGFWSLIFGEKQDGLLDVEDIFVVRTSGGDRKEYRFASSHGPISSNQAVDFFLVE